MERSVSNAFALEGKEEPAGDAPALAASSVAKGKLIAEPSGDECKSENKDDDGKQLVKALTESATAEISGSYSDQLKLPLVWIDLEMTGLDIQVDRILEAACIITDGNLANLVEGPNLVIHQTKDCLDKMNEWCLKNHGDSGLTNKALKSTITEEEAERQLIEFVKKHVGSDKAHLAGNSVYTDYIFLKKYMPSLASLFSHVLVDVSSVTALCIRWFPKDYKKAPRKEKKHRALDDIRESILELQYYKEKIFKKKQAYN